MATNSSAGCIATRIVFSASEVSAASSGSSILQGILIGLDVSLAKTAICVVDRDGTVQWQGKVPSEPSPIIERLAEWSGNIELAGIEACPLSEWLHRGLRQAGVPIVCIETRQAQRFLSSRPVKTDKNDARGIAEMMRLSHYRPVHVKSLAAQSMRTTLAARMQLVSSQLQIEGTIRGLLRIYGLKIGAIHRNRFAARVADLLEEAGLSELSAAIEPMLRVREVMRAERKAADRILAGSARRSDLSRRLMTIPGVGPVTSLAYIATIDDPGRFGASKAVGAHLGLTPRVYQSGEIHRSTDWGKSVSAAIE
jgi:transposase